MYQNLEQFVEEKELELLKLTYGHADLPVIDFLRTALRQAGELTVEAVAVRPIQDSTLHDNTAHHSFNAAVDCARVASVRWLNKE